MFKTKALASRCHEMKYSQDQYLERTKRNHYWLGGESGQLKLKDLHVGIAGLGGMGSNLAEIMVRLGVGHIKIADPDTIEKSNLNRQVIANKNTVGMKKTEASELELRNISEDFELVVYDDGITEENAHEFVSDLDVIIDEIDVFPLTAHTWLHRAANKLNIPLYSGFIIGLGTHIYKFHGTKYTFDDFMEHNEKEIHNPTPNFLINRMVKPFSSYMRSEQNQMTFKKEIEKGEAPIFGTSTYLSQSLLAIRLISDLLNLNKTLGGVPTPVMPKFIKADPLDLKIEIYDINELMN